MKIGNKIIGSVNRHETASGPIIRAALYGFQFPRDIYKPYQGADIDNRYTMGVKVGRYEPPPQLDPKRGWVWDFPGNTDMQQVEDFLYQMYVARFIVET